MPKGEYDTPGKYRLSKYGNSIEMKCPGPLPGQENRYLPHAIREDEWLVNQLNKATHFERMLAALKALFENTDDGDCTATDLFYDYDYGVKGGAHWCKVCFSRADDYVRVTHDSDCIVGCAEDAIAECTQED